MAARNIGIRSYHTSDGIVTQWTLATLALCLCHKSTKRFLILFLALDRCIDPLLPRCGTVKRVTTWYTYSSVPWFFLLWFNDTTNRRRCQFRMNDETSFTRSWNFICRSEQIDKKFDPLITCRTSCLMVPFLVKGVPLFITWNMKTMPTWCSYTDGRCAR